MDGPLERIALPLYSLFFNYFYRVLGSSLCSRVPLCQQGNLSTTQLLQKVLILLQGSDSFKWRVLDIVISILTSLIAVSAFYGTWTGLDFMFEASDQISTSQKGLNGAYCYVCINKHMIYKEW